MSSYGINVPEPSQIDYHADLHARRARRALDRIDPGDVLAVIDGKVAQEADPAKHPLYTLVCWHLEKCLTPMDGAEFFDRWRARDRCHQRLPRRGHEPGEGLAMPHPTPRPHALSPSRPYCPIFGEG
jgi:hypothetical protein